MIQITWTPPYLGVTHANYSPNGFWATIEEHAPDFFTCTMWFPGCRFSPKSRQFDTFEEARKAAEEYLSKQ